MGQARTDSSFWSQLTFPQQAGVVLAAVVFAIFLVFAIQNGQVVAVRVPKKTYMVAVWELTLASFIAGTLVASATMLFVQWKKKHR